MSWPEREKQEKKRKEKKKKNFSDDALFFKKVKKGAQDTTLSYLTHLLAERLGPVDVAYGGVEQQQARHVAARLGALLAQLEVAVREGKVPEALPLGVGLGGVLIALLELLHKVVRDVQLLQLQRQVELLVGVLRDVQRLLLQPLALKKPRYARVL